MLRVPVYRRKRYYRDCLLDDIDKTIVAGHRLSVYESGIVMMGKKVLSRIIMNAPQGVRVDHVNMDTFDNRRHNLRLATASQNALNSNAHRDNKTGYKGVYLCQDTGRYRAQISINGKRTSLGRYNTAEEAARAYDAACITLHKDFARPNGV